MRPTARIVKVSAFCAVGLAFVAGAGKAFAQIPYPTPGTVNPVTYTFTAAATGDITAYFVSKGGAAYTEVLGMLDNGVPTGITGLDNQTSVAGQSLDLGSVHAGDTLTFFIDVINPNLGDVYSNPSLNAAYDSTYSPSPGVNHVYSTGYDASSHLLNSSIPSGTYVGFEDLPASNPPDYNYADEQYVFTDVSVATTPDSTSTMGLLSLTVAGIGWLRRRLK